MSVRNLYFAIVMIGCASMVIAGLAHDGGLMALGIVCAIVGTIGLAATPPDPS